MSDTPRTDALLETIFDRVGQVGPRNCQEEWVALCRKLESELKDARQIASKYDDRYFATRELLTVSTERAERLERELTEARPRIKRLEEAGNDLVWWFCQKEESQLSSMQSAALKQWRDLRGRRNP